MSAQVREKTSGSDLLYAGLGTLAGVAVVITVQTLWQRYVGGAEALAALSANSRLAQEAQVMGLPLAEGSKAYWYSARAGGVVAYLLLWMATVWGVLMSSKMVKGKIDASLMYGMHEFLPMLAMVFAGLHALVLMGDTYIGFSLVDVLVPFAASYRPLWTGLGSVALYLSIALIASFYLKNVVSRKVWRAFHYTAFLAFGLAMVHGLMAGSDAANPVVRWMYILTGASLLFVTLYRIFIARGEDAPSKAAAQPSTTSAPPRPRPARRASPAEVGTEPVV